MNKITPFLWFDGKVEEAIGFYTSIFKNSKILDVKYWGEGNPFPKDQIMISTFELDGQRFHAFDAGPRFRFNEAISFFIECKTQDEVDYFWNKLSEGGEESMCGWLKDKFGISWQVVPSALTGLIGHKDREKAGRAMQAMMKMRKLDIKTLQDAFDGK